MIRSFIVGGIVTVAVALSSIAQASKKPTVCLAFSEANLVVDGKPEKVAICQDGKKPVVLTSYVLTTIRGEDGESVKVAIGWR